jgi:hypothetical protein
MVWPKEKKDKFRFQKSKLEGYGISAQRYVLCCNRVGTLRDQSQNDFQPTKLLRAQLASLSVHLL